MSQTTEKLLCNVSHALAGSAAAPIPNDDRYVPSRIKGIHNNHGPLLYDDGLHLSLGLGYWTTRIPIQEAVGCRRWCLLSYEGALFNYLLYSIHVFLLPQCSEKRFMAVAGTSSQYSSANFRFPRMHLHAWSGTSFPVFNSAFESS